MVMKRIRIYEDDMAYIEEYRQLAGLRKHADAVKAIIDNGPKHANRQTNIIKARIENNKPDGS